MKRVVFLPLMFAVVTFPVTLGAQTSAPAAKAAAPAAKPATPAAKPTVTIAQAGEPRTIELTVKDDMKFDKPNLTAKPGEKLKIVLKNMGTMPKMVGGHNFVLLKAGASVLKFVEAATMSAPTYIPEALKDQVLASTLVTGPGEVLETTFTAPAAGTYNFLCSFAGHFTLGMKGTLTVK
jgi:azurin